MAKLSYNTITFTHNDLDGVGVGILAKAAIGSSAEVHYCSYQNVDDKINQRLDELEVATDLPFILIADLGIKPETAERLNRYQGGKIWLDHHKTNIELASCYEWATIDTEASGTLLVFDEFENIPRRFQDFAIRVDDYDRWVHLYTESKQLNRLFYVIGIKKFEKRCLMEKEPHRINEMDSVLLAVEEEKIERYVNKLEKSVKIFELHGEQFGVVFADQYQSEAAHELMNRFDLVAIALIDANSKKVSFRSVPNFDVGSVAKRLGGGGHKNAAGVEFDYKRIDGIDGNRVPLVGAFYSIENTLLLLFSKFKSVYESIEKEEVSELIKGAKNNAI